MRWRFLDPELSGFEFDIPDSEQTVCVLGPVQDHRLALLGGEREYIERMVEHRQFEFSSGRHFAHLALAELGLPEEPILRQERAPVWPNGSVGSITHSDSVAAAMASTDCLGVGIDIEALDRVEEKMFRVLFTDPEKQTLSGFDFDAPSVMFSAKEALYKAVYPTGKKFIGFQEAEVSLDASNNTFSARYLGDHEPNKLLEQGRGYWQFSGGHVVTVFLIPDKIR